MSNTIISYKGEITFDKIDELLTLYNQKMPDTKSPLCRKRIFSVLVECLENAYRHNYNSPDNHPQVEVSLTQLDDNYTVTVTNYTDAENLTLLTHRIDDINKLCIDDVKQLYISSMYHAQISSKGGAGLGLLKIMRSSQNPINYKTKSIGKYSQIEVAVIVSDTK